MSPIDLRDAMPRKSIVSNRPTFNSPIVVRDGGPQKRTGIDQSDISTSLIVVRDAMPLRSMHSSGGIHFSRSQPIFVMDARSPNHGCWSTVWFASKTTIVRSSVSVDGQAVDMVFAHEYTKK
jgi:hypothetical protein